MREIEERIETDGGARPTRRFGWLLFVSIACVLVVFAAVVVGELAFPHGPVRYCIAENSYCDRARVDLTLDDYLSFKRFSSWHDPILVAAVAIGLGASGVNWLLRARK